VWFSTAPRLSIIIAPDEPEVRLDLAFESDTQILDVIVIPPHVAPWLGVTSIVIDGVQEVTTASAIPFAALSQVFAHGILAWGRSISIGLVRTRHVLRPLRVIRQRRRRILLYPRPTPFAFVADVLVRSKDPVERHAKPGKGRHMLERFIASGGIP
jgi:hypothetical protein